MGLLACGLSASRGQEAAASDPYKNMSLTQLMDVDVTSVSGRTEALSDAAASIYVITNDDIKPSPYSSFGGLFYMSTGSINDCDAGCFDQVRAMAMVNSETNPNWRRDVLRQLDLVRSDGEWQAYLHDVYRAHNKVCQSTFDKQDELRKSGGSFRNLGPQQIAITEKYDEQAKAAQDEVSAQVARQQQIQRKFADKPYANAFATIQGTRMMGGFCSQAKVIYPEIR